MDKIRVLHCPEMVAGNPQQLARAERELGLDSWAVAFQQGMFGYKTDEVLWSEGDNRLMLEIKRLRLLWQAIKGFDIIHFNFGQSIMQYCDPQSEIADAEHVSAIRGILRKALRYYHRFFELGDLPLLKKMGKGIVVTYQGDDARQGDFCQSHFEINPASEVDPGYYSADSDAHKRYRIGKFAKYANRIYALNPDLLWVLPARAQFLPYSHIDLRDWRPIYDRSVCSKAPLIVHAPSHRGVKGTKYILDVVSRLKREGVAQELSLVEGVPHTEARRIYERADLLIDQLLCGWYGGLAVEFMALGKPVICYIREGDLRFIPEQMREDLPIINATPTTLYSVVKDWLTVRKHGLPEKGRLSRAYVEKWHDPLKIAAQVKEDYEVIVEAKRKGRRS